MSLHFLKIWDLAVITVSHSLFHHFPSMTTLAAIFWSNHPLPGLSATWVPHQQEAYLLPHQPSCSCMTLLPVFPYLLNSHYLLSSIDFPSLSQFPKTPQILSELPLSRQREWKTGWMNPSWMYHPYTQSSIPSAYWLSDALCSRVSQWALRLEGSVPGQVTNFLSNSVSSSVLWISGYLSTGVL